MALPVTVISSASITWSDHKNQNHGGAQRLAVYSDATDDGTFYQLGNSAQYVTKVGGYTGQANHKLLRVRVFLQRVGSPTGSLLVEVRPEGSPDFTPDMSILWGQSRSVPVSAVPTSAKTEVVFTFPVPVSLPASDTDAFGVVLTISAQGDSSNYIKVFRGTSTSDGASRAYGTSTWNVDETFSMCKVVEISKSGARVFAIDKTNSVLKPYITDTNTGASFSAEVNTGSMTTSANFKSASSQMNINDVGTSYIAHARSTANQVGIYKRSESVGPSLDPATAVSFTTLSTNVTGTAPYFSGRRVDGTAVFVAQGATETIMGTARRRVKLSFYNGSVWSSLFDVAGSTNTPNSTLPGDGVDYDLRWAGLDPNGDFHIVYSKSDTSTLQYRKFTSVNVFTTINTLNGAVASATVNYSVGLGTFLYKSPDWYVAVPYVDNSSSTLKEARCKTTDTATSGNWTITQIVAASAETSGSNPAVLIADNIQGGKVFCLRVKPTTKGLAFTHDGGTGVWAAEIDWRGATQTVGGISGFYTEDGVALVYLEEGTTPDELRYDRL